MRKVLLLFSHWNLTTWTHWEGAKLRKSLNFRLAITLMITLRSEVGSKMLFTPGAFGPHQRMTPRSARCFVPGLRWQGQDKSPIKRHRNRPHFGFQTAALKFLSVCMDTNNCPYAEWHVILCWNSLLPANYEANTLSGTSRYPPYICTIFQIYMEDIIMYKIQINMKTLMNY